MKRLLYRITVETEIRNMEKQREELIKFMEEHFAELNEMLNEKLISKNNILYMKTLVDNLKDTLKKKMEFDQIIADRCEDDEMYYALIEQSYDYELETLLKLATIESFITKSSEKFPRTFSPPVKEKSVHKLSESLGLV